jgi:hypothetical protein
MARSDARSAAGGSCGPHARGGGAGAANNRSPPTTPGSFRVTSTNSYTASLAWLASSDNSGGVAYVLTASLLQNVLRIGAAIFSTRSWP